MIRLFRWTYALFICSNVHAQLSHVQSENAYITAAAYSNHFRDAFSFLSNPACLGATPGFQSGILAERKWMLRELDHSEMSVNVPFGNGGMGIAFQQSGDGDYHEQGLVLAYGISTGRLQIGTGFSYLRDQAAGYPAVGFGGARAGISYQVSEKLKAGWELGLPVFGIAGKTNPEKGPQFFNMGFGYEWTPDLFISLQLEKYAGSPAGITGYIEYRYGDQFFFAFGINGHAAAPYFKSGWRKNRLCIELYTLFEPVLGFTPGIAILWESKKSKG
jgi:hypothetical protein